MEGADMTVMIGVMALRMYPLKVLSIDLGYQYNMFPEIKRKFGQSHLLKISIGLTL
jgi:hypothetical protein